MNQTYTIKSILQMASARLNVEAKMLEAQLLLQHVLQANCAWLIAHADDVLQADAHAAFEALLKRRIDGEPIAYILGEREFYGLRLKVTPDTLIPRPDTETLVEAALAKIPQNANRPSFSRKRESIGFSINQTLKMDSRFRGNDEGNEAEFKILDLGTGTGAIALAIAKNRPQTQVVAVDFSESALNVARENAENLNIQNVTFFQSDWFSALTHERFDVIVSNPPYIENADVHVNQGDLRFEPKSALTSGADGLDDIRHIVSNCLVHLKPQGWVLLEHGYNQAQVVQDLMAAEGLVEIATLQDLGGNDRVTLAKNPLIVSQHWG